MALQLEVFFALSCRAPWWPARRARPRLSTLRWTAVFSPAQTLLGPNYSISAGLGKQVGSNLFHSFGQFRSGNGRKRHLQRTRDDQQCAGQGGRRESIVDRRGDPIRLTGANLYLINPSGGVFGPNATVNVSGSFHVSTADYLKLSDGAKFQAINPDGSTLSAAPPAAPLP